MTLTDNNDVNWRQQCQLTTTKTVSTDDNENDVNWRWRKWSTTTTKTTLMTTSTDENDINWWWWRQRKLCQQTKTKKCRLMTTTKNNVNWQWRKWCQLMTSKMTSTDDDENGVKWHVPPHCTSPPQVAQDHWPLPTKQRSTHITWHVLLATLAQ